MKEKKKQELEETNFSEGDSKVHKVIPWDKDAQMDCREGTDKISTQSGTAPVSVGHKEAAERIDHTEVASEKSFDLQLDILTLESFSQMNDSQRKSPVQFVSCNCYGRGKSLEDIIVPRLPLIYKKLEAEKHMGPPAVSETSCLPNRPFKGRGRAQLLREQTEYVSTAPGNRSALSEWSAPDCTIPAQDADGTSPTAPDSFPKSKSLPQKGTPAGCDADCSVFHPLSTGEENRKTDKETLTGKGKKRKKINYISLISFIHEARIDKPRGNPTEGGRENCKQHSRDLGERTQTPFEDSAFSNAEDDDFNQELSIADTHDATKDLPKGGISCEVSSGGPDLQDEENVEKTKTNDISCLELVDGELAHDGSDAKHVYENKFMIYPDVMKVDEVNQCDKVENCSQRLSPSDEALAESTNTEAESCTKDCEDGNLPSVNKDDEAGSSVVTKRLYSFWKLEGLDVIQVDNVPKNCTKELEALVANTGSILASEKKSKKGGNSLRFRLNSREACRWTVACLHEADCIFPGNVLKCYLVEEDKDSTEL